MKKKIILLLLIFSVFLGGVASAGPINGLFEGKSIVKVLFNGKEVKAQDVPAYSENGRTMIPLYMMKEMGASVTWDQKSFSANVQMSQGKVESSVNEISKKLGKNVFLVETAADANTGFTRISIFIDNAKIFNSTMFDSLKILYDEPYESIFIQDVAGNYMLFTRQNVRDYFDGKLTNTEFGSKVEVHQATPATTPTITPSPKPTTTPVISVSTILLYSGDGKTYLGKATSNKYDSESIFNEFGTYGSKYGANSIFNEYGTYGSAYSSKSAFNKYALEPPILVLDGTKIGTLTVNNTISGSISPYNLLQFLIDIGY